MSLTAKQFATLKRGNVGVNSAKVKVRVPEVFKKASKEDKDAILKLAGFATANNIYTIKNSGAVSPKAVLSMAQILKISPYYLTGESGSVDFTEDMLTEFYKKCTEDKKKPVKTETPKSAAKSNADKPAKASKKATVAVEKPVKVVKEAVEKPVKAVKETVEKPVKAVKETVEKPVEAVKEIVAPSAPVLEIPKKAKEPVKSTKTVKIDDTSLVILLEALVIRAKYSDEAKETYNKIVELLVK
jgi:hypothetical protein